MAEPRNEDQEEDVRDRRDARNSDQAIDRLERTKPDHLHSSQGPLSSLRAAIKRTRTNSSGEHCRERRRPEITIVSAEPLANSNWFPSASGILPHPLPVPQPSWSGSIQAEPQPPPSYDQVIKEKTQEETVTGPTAAPRSLACTSSSATQTDPVREEPTPTGPKVSPAAQSDRKPDVKKPQKPPRPLLHKSTSKDPTIIKPAPTNEQTTNIKVFIDTENQNDSNVVDYTHTRARSVTVQWDHPTKELSECLKSSIDSQSTPSPEPKPTQCPVPFPRLKSCKKPIPEAVKVQTLVSLSENGDNIKVTTNADLEELSSNKYLKELLEVFGADSHCEQTCDKAVQSNTIEESEEAGEMSAVHSHRNIRSRIAAFEDQASAEEEPVVQQPMPQPRNIYSKPPVAAKPSIASKASIKRGIENNNVEVSYVDVPQKPSPAPRPQPPKKPVGLPSIEEPPEMLPRKVAILPPLRPSIMAKVNSFKQQEENHAVRPPPVAAKPLKGPLQANLNLNNHNSTSMDAENDCGDRPSNHVPFKPQHSVDSGTGPGLNRHNIVRRPTTIRVNSMTSRSLSLDNPPPLPAQKPVGSLPPPVSHKEAPSPVFPSLEPELSLPPRRSGSKVLPPRPTPAKAGPGRPPPPRLDATGQASHVQASQWGASRRAPAQTQKPKRKGPVLPPRPTPGHRLYNKYTLELPHGIAISDYNGINTGELSFQKNEVILLLEETDSRTVMCQAGDAKGLVKSSHMTIITPLSSVPAQPQSSDLARCVGDSCGLQVQAMHDFTPEGPGELALRAGDVVNMVELVDSDWYRGTCRGSSGFFPVSYVNVLSNSPSPSNEKKKPTKTVSSGPRCVARFDFEGERGDELSFSEGDVIILKEYIEDSWAKGQIDHFTGIFPLIFVDVIEDLPPPPMQQQTQSSKMPLPGMVALPNTQPEAVKSVQVSQPGVEWVVALYDFNGQTDGDLSFKQGDRILVTKQLDVEWWIGRLKGREGIFPKAFVDTGTGQPSLSNSQQGSYSAGMTAKSLYHFTASCEEEHSLQVGDIITNLESIDEEWFLGDLRGKRAFVPKNYVQVLR